MGECLNRHYVRTKFRPNPRGSGIFCVDLTWNDPCAVVSKKSNKHYRVKSSLQKGSMWLACTYRDAYQLLVCLNVVDTSSSVSMKPKGYQYLSS